LGITLEFDDQFSPSDAAQAEVAARDVLGRFTGDWDVRFFNDSGRGATYGVRVRTREMMVVRIFDGRKGLGSAVRLALNSAVAQIEPRA
jgi:hypothetical protein